MAHKLLIVDDEELSREGLAKMIDWSAFGFVVVGAYEDGAAVVEHLKTKPVDVVLTDIRMTDISGVELAGWIRRHCPRTKVVFISAYSRFEYAKEGMRHGVVHYLLKPLSTREIEEVFTDLRGELDAEVERRGEEAFQGPLHGPGRVGPGGGVSAGREPAGHDGDGPSASGDHARYAGRGALPEAVRRARAFIRANAPRPLTLESIAEEACVSPGYLSRVFSARTGESVTAYIRRARIENAKDLLASSDMRVYEICRAVGYSDLRNFYKIFKDSVGMTPSEFRAHRVHV